MKRTKTLVALSTVLLISLTGCEKNSYQSCIDFQTEAAKRDYEKRKNSQYPFDPDYTLQNHIDWTVSNNCKGVK